MYNVYIYIPIKDYTIHIIFLPYNTLTYPARPWHNPLLPCTTLDVLAGSDKSEAVAVASRVSDKSEAVAVASTVENAVETAGDD